MPKRKTEGGRGDPSPQFDAFIGQVVTVALSVAPEVAELLDPQGEPSEAQWAGSRERGLKLCALMLNYARAELADDAEAERLDAAILLLEALIDDASDERDVETEIKRRSRVGDPAD
jgi:hypothetical protein